MKTIPTIRTVAKSFAVALLGRETKPRTILRGLAAGYRIVVSPAEHLGYIVGTAEPHLERALRRFVAPGDTAYDIGANIGYVSLSLAKLVGARGHVFAFEPLPENLRLLHQAIEENGLSNMTILDAAASDTNGETVLRVAENSSMASLVWHRDNPAAVEFEVRTVVIDDLVTEGRLPPPKFVKIDVEGAEGAVVRGMQRTIAKSRPVLFIECSDAGRETTWSLLSGLEYRCESAITGARIEKFEEYRHSDFLWLP